MSLRIRRGIDYRSLKQPEFDVNLSKVKGQEHVERALKVAAAGGHNMLMVGQQSQHGSLS